MSNINKIKVSGQTYSIQDENACKVVELTQAQYDALPASAKTSNSLFVITDATAGDLSNYYTKSETSGATEISTALASKQDTLVSRTNIKTINNESILGEGNITIEGGVSESVFTSYSAATNARISEDEEVTAAALNVLNDGLSAKQDTLVAGDNITISGNVISAEGGIDSGTVQTMIDGSISGKADTSAVTVAINSAVSGKADSSAVTQEISAAVSGKVDTNAFNTYSAATNARLAEDEEVTAAALNDLNEALSGKADTSSVYTKSEVDTALNAKQDQLVSGTNIKTINNESILGSGNITIEGGGGKAVSGGTNISITTGETSDTINCTLPITATTDTTNKAIIIGQSITATNTSNGCVIIGSGAKGTLYDVIIGRQAKNNAGWNEVVAIGNQAKGYSQSVSIGSYTETYNNYQEGCVAIGYYAKAKNMKNAVAIGYEVSTTGTTKTNINNQLKIDASNQVYISNSANTSTYCLQEKIENTEAALGGLKLVKLTQSEYDALATKDSNTLFVIIN